MAMSRRPLGWGFMCNIKTKIRSLRISDLQQQPSGFFVCRSQQHGKRCLEQVVPGSEMKC